MTLLLHIPILIIIFTIVNIFFNKQKKRSINSYQPTLDTGDRVFINLLVSVFYGLIVMIITLLAADFKSEDTLKYVKVNIVSLDRTNSLNGAINNGFLISSGYINSEKVYTVMKIINENTYQEENIPQNTLIIEDAQNENSYFTYNTCDREKNTIFSLVHLQNISYCNSYKKLNYELHIPKDTIIKKINMN